MAYIISPVLDFRAKLEFLRLNGAYVCFASRPVGSMPDVGAIIAPVAEKTKGDLPMLAQKARAALWVENIKVFRAGPVRRLIPKHVRPRLWKGKCQCRFTR